MNMDLQGLVLAALFVVAGGLPVACTGPKGGADAIAPDSAAALDAGDLAETCPPGLVPWPGGGCAPRVDECPNPWELPLIGGGPVPLKPGEGGCVAIGPRACPKLWDPEADVDCEPGKLMEYDGNACPEGFVLTEDEVACIPFFAEDGVCGENEIPVLGGGCKKVGPAAPGIAPGGDLDAPDFDVCPPGELATGGGCIRVGPRACPKLWNPGAEVDCEVGDILPCPDGWSESDDGMYCDPKYAECSLGERSLVGGGCERVVPLAEDCPPGPFPVVPEGAEDAVYVSAASTCTGACGTPESPFPTITAAIEVVPDGGYVLVGAGEYAEGLAISKSVHVLGLCSAKVTIAGSVDVVSKKDSAIESAGVVVADTSQAELAGVKVASAAAGVAVVGTTGVEVHDVEVTGSAGAGVYAGPGSEVTIDRLWLHDTAPGSKGWLLFGVFADGGARLEMRQSLLDATMGAGSFARGVNTEMTVDETTIRDTRCTVGKVAGYGARVDSNATLRVLGSCLDGNRDSGILAEGGAFLDVEATAVLRTQPDDKEERGWGLQVGESATATVTGCLLGENTAAGMIVSGVGTKIELSATVVRDTKPNAKGEYGTGVQTSGSASMVVSGCLFDGNKEVGVIVSGSGAKASLSATLVRNTLLSGAGKMGYGMQVADGGLVAVSRCLFEGNTWGGIGVWQPGAEMNLSETVVRDTIPNGVGKGGRGLEVGGAASVVASNCLFEGNPEAGILVGGSGTKMDLSATLVRDGMSAEDGKPGRGIDVQEGATMAVSGCLLQGNTAAGIVVTDSSTELNLSATVVRGTTQEGEGGRGLDVGNGASAVVSDCLFESNTELGIVVGGGGTTMSLSATVVQGTLPDGEGEFGHGLQVGQGASAVVSSCLFKGNTAVGIRVGHPDTKVDLSATVVQGTMPDGQGRGGVGMQTGEGAQATGSGCLLGGNTEAGISVWDSNTRMDLSATVVKDTMPDAKGGVGVGAVVLQNASMFILDSLFVENTTGGVFVLDGGSVRLEKSAVRNTRKGGAGAGGHFQSFGDGVVSGEGMVELVATLVAGNGRSGVYFSSSSGSVSDSVIVDNEFYGLAMEECADQVEWEGKGNFILGNATAMPPDEAVEVTTSTGGMPVPPAPGMIEVAPDPVP